MLLTELTARVLQMIYAIVINYNNYKDTVECVDSLKRTYLQRFKLVIIDNGSTDESAHMLKKIENDNRVVISSNINIGFSGGNNIGIKYALNNNADFILLLNNDTVVTPEFLSRLLSTYYQVSTLQRTDKIILSPKINYFYDKKKIWFCGGTWNSVTGRTTHIGINEEDVGQFKDPFRVSFLSGCCMLIPAKAIQEVGLMSEDYFLYCEDTDYCLRLMKAGYELWVDPSSLIYHKVNASTGKASDTYTYYSVRNKQYLIDRYIKRFYRPIARGYSKLEIINKVRKKEYSSIIVKKAISDYKKGIIGK